jgi:N-methylhydantoinase A
MVLTRSVDVRYRSQTHELIIPLTSGPLDPAALRGLVEDFEQTYEDHYGKGAGFREAGFELTLLRVDAVGRTPKPAFAPHTASAGAAAPRTRPVYDVTAARWIETPVVPWESLRPDAPVDGPAIVEHPTTTVHVPAERKVTIDAVGNLLITL